MRRVRVEIGANQPDFGSVAPERLVVLRSYSSSLFDCYSRPSLIGGCERIRKTPLPRTYAIRIRQFIILFLATLPFALLRKVGWLTPIVTVLVAFPILALDEIGNLFQAPFSSRSLNHLPLDELCRTIEDDLFAMLSAKSATPAEGDARKEGTQQPTGVH
jgi:putative membrane protein